MASISTKSASSFGPEAVSHRLTKVEEDPDAESDVTSRQSTSRGLNKKLTDKEERFKNKYRWAEKQLKLRTGKSDGYSFLSIKAGLHRQDFRDTLNWSPINHAKVAATQHLSISDVVTQILHKSCTPCDSKAKTNTAIVESDNEVQSSVASDRMSEQDWQLAKSRKLDPLRSRSANRISAKMNLDSFIDSALSEQPKEDAMADTPNDMSLGDLQSAKLIESRFGWSKVRRAVTTTTAVKTSVKLTSSSDLSLSKPLATITKEDSTYGFESSATSPNGSEKLYNGQVQAASRSPVPRPSTASAASAAGRGRGAPLSFCVPESATHIRPRSALLSPSAHPHIHPHAQSLMLAPLDEFVQIVRQERPKTASRVSDTSTHSSAHSTRPRTATLRISAPPPLQAPSLSSKISDSDIIDAMLTGPLAAHQDGGRAVEGVALRMREKLISGNYSGLIYHDPNRQTTWQGVGDLLAPPPLLRASSELDEAEAARVAFRTDMRWAGKTLNSYRPWSPERHAAPPPRQHHYPPEVSEIDMERATGTGSSSRNNSARLSARLGAVDGAGTITLNTAASTTMSEHASVKELLTAETAAEEWLTRRMRRPTSEMTMPKKKDESSVASVSSLGIDPTRTPKPNLGRQTSSPSLFNPASSSGAVVVVVSAANSPEAVNMRPFSARPASAAAAAAEATLPGVSPRHPRPSTGASRLSATAAASASASAPGSGYGGGGARSNSVTSATGTAAGASLTTPTPSRGSKVWNSKDEATVAPTPSGNVAAQSSSVFSSQVHTVSRSSGGGSKRAPLLINIIMKPRSSSPKKNR